MKPTIAHILEVLTRDPQIVLVYLFGSEATKTSHSMSDVDIAVLLDRGDSVSLLRKENELVSTLVMNGIGEIDLLLLNAAGIELQQKIVTEGRLLYVRSERERVAFEEHVLLEYLDNKPFFEVYDHGVLQRLKKST